ncbi:hypothetical protein C7377_1654 [Balneicella halophila]|uniref:Uncharacterized protein n=1 Tax=Balneicella halophila TaxID=1537566 RepID=A0A7L4UN89_BALHA|nr:hypothetical protein [Balneicella halophila]PVX50009.1 hypothetical protein C7377_1654 [Balneicella halophila]
MENYILMALIVGSLVLLVYLWTERKNKNVKVPNIPVSRDEKAIFALKMQAYERLSLFLERSKPQSLLMRLMHKTSDAKQLQLLLLNTIREEFEHNFSQQIYVSESLWQSISMAKDRLIQLINKAASTTDVETKERLGEELLMQYSNEKEDYIGTTLQQLRKEARIIQGQ